MKPAQLKELLEYELLPKERIIWSAQPDPDAFVNQVLPFAVIWLTGLFLLSIGILIDSPGEEQQILPVLIGMLIFVAIVGIVELVFIPMKARDSLYALTDKRSILMHVRAKPSANAQVLSLGKTLVSQSTSTPLRFYLTHMPAQIVFVVLSWDVLRSLSVQFNMYIAVGYFLIAVGWFYQWFTDMRIPSAWFRDPGKRLYTVDGYTVCVEQVLRENINNVHIRRKGNELADIFVVSFKDGCLRLKNAARGDEAKVAFRSAPDALDVGAGTEAKKTADVPAEVAGKVDRER